MTLFSTNCSSSSTYSSSVLINICVCVPHIINNDGWVGCSKQACRYFIPGTRSIVSFVFRSCATPLGTSRRETLYLVYTILLGRCERHLKFRCRLELSLGLRTPSLPCLRAFALSTASLEGRAAPASDGCSPVRASRSLAPPTSATTPNSRDICCGKETRSFYFMWSWKFVSLSF